jgi:hypothetical protein
MRGRTVLILLVLVIGLIAFIELYESELPSTDERAAQARRVVDLDPDEVVALDWSWQDGEVRLERVSTAGSNEERPSIDRDWLLVAPNAAPADSSLVTALLDVLTGLEKQRVLEDTNLHDVGLDPPRATVRLVSDSREVELRVGSQVPAGDSMIVESKSGELAVVDNRVWSDLTRAPGDWRSRRVLTFDPASVKRVEIKTAETRVGLDQRDARFWLEGGQDDLADSERVEDLLALLAGIEVESFADELAAAQVAVPTRLAAGTIEVMLDGRPEPERIVWGGEVESAEGLFFVDAGAGVFATSADLRPFLSLPAEDWRSLALTSLETFAIDALRIRQPDLEELVLTREGAEWLRDEGRISFPEVSELLYAIVDARAASSAARSAAGTGTPEALEPTLEIWLEGETRQENIVFFSDGDGGTEAWVEGRPVVLMVADNEFTEILAKLAAVRAAESIKVDSIE